MVLPLLLDKGAFIKDVMPIPSPPGGTEKTDKTGRGGRRGVWAVRTSKIGVQRHVHAYVWILIP